MNFRSGFVALVGLPNSGKSTLLNCVIGEKVAIVSPKPQTTRRRIVGIVNRPQAQIIYVDSPGMIEHSSSQLNEFLIDEYQGVLKEADGALAIIGSDERDESKIMKVVDAVERVGKPWAIVVTKSDLLNHESHNRLQKLFEGKNVLFTSATGAAELTREDVINLSTLLLPESQPLYDSELFTTENVREMSAEIIREKCFLNLHQEIPFGLAIKITSFKEEAKITRIEADVIVERDAHKKIVIGQGASTLKKIGIEARVELQKLLDTKVFLGLHVVSKPKWMHDPTLMRELGYVHRE
jgi:GTPase